MTFNSFETHPFHFRGPYWRPPRREEYLRWLEEYREELKAGLVKADQDPLPVYLATLGGASRRGAMRRSPMTDIREVEGGDAILSSGQG